MDKKYFKIGLTAFTTVAACITFFFAIYRADVILGFLGKMVKSAEPIIIGLILAYLLMPVKKFVEAPVYEWLRKTKLGEKKSRKAAKTISILSAVVFLLIIIALLIAIIVPSLVSSVVGLIDAIPRYVDSFLAWVDTSGVGESQIANYVSEVIAQVTLTVEEWAKNQWIPEAQKYITQITSGVMSVVKTLLNFIIGIIVMVYAMSINETLKGQSKKMIYALFPSKKGNMIIETMRKSNDIFGGFIIGKILDSAIIGILAYIGCMVLQMPSALLIAFIIGVTNVIPFFGPFIGAVPAVLLVLIQSPLHALYLAIFILVLQQVDGNIIGPKILGDSTGLSSFWVMFSILVFGGLFGFFGMLLGVPIFAVLYYLFQQFLAYRMEQKKLSNLSEDYIDLISIDEKDGTMHYREVEEPKEKEEDNDK